jgi:hypothetical protein
LQVGCKRQESCTPSLLPSPCRCRLLCHPPPRWVLCSPPLYMSSAAVSGPPLVRSSTPLLSSCCPPSDCPPLSTPALSDRPALSTVASRYVVHRPIALQSVLRPPPLLMSFAAQPPCIARHLLVSCSPPSLLSRCSPPACLVSSTAPSRRAIHCPLTPNLLYLNLIVEFSLSLSLLPHHCPSQNSKMKNLAIWSKMI